MPCSLSIFGTSFGSSHDRYSVHDGDGLIEMLMDDVLLESATQAVAATPGERQNGHVGKPDVVAPRLLNLRQGAAYLGVSYWSLRDYVLAGLIPAVKLPPLRPREGERQRKPLRRVLVDRQDLDAFVEARKSRSALDVPVRVDLRPETLGQIEPLCPHCARLARP